MKISIVASRSQKAQNSLRILKKKYSEFITSFEEADVIVALGGDGFMLHTLHRFIPNSKSVFGMRRGTVGFLMNRYSDDDLIDRIKSSQVTNLHPLKMEATTTKGKRYEALAINEVSLLRQTRQSARITVYINEQLKIEQLVGDGIMVATPAGSTAYNLSAHGPVLPLGSDILALTPISPFRPRRWKGAVIPASAKVRFSIQDCGKRPVSATADNFEVRDVDCVQIYEDKSVKLKLLFDPEHNLEDRIINEQFII
ncbi:MAG: NAD kinase [Gammaproteobacteria bacterium]|jgi:NAD+ kinase|nr:NAD kinase [Xanthomonadales bacterium]